MTQPDYIQVHYFQIVGKLDDERKNVVFAGEYNYVIDQIIQHAKGTHGEDLSREYVERRVAGKPKKAEKVVEDRFERIKKLDVEEKERRANEKTDESIINNPIKKVKGKKKKK